MTWTTDQDNLSPLWDDCRHPATGKTGRAPLARRPAACCTPVTWENSPPPCAQGAADGLRVRAVGGGHSFTPVAVTDGVHIRLDSLDALERVAPQDGRHDARHGRRRHPPGRSEHPAGGPRSGHAQPRRHRQAVDRGGDLDRHARHRRDSWAGWPRRSSAPGWSPPRARSSRPPRRSSPELFELARLGLGSVGVLAAVTLEVVPAYRLEAREEPWPLEEVLEQLDGPDGLVEGNDHFEFYWFPHTRRALTKRNNRVARRRGGPPAAAARVGGRRAPVQRGVLAGQRRRHPRAVDHGVDQRVRRARAVLPPLHGTVRGRLRLPPPGEVPRDGVRGPARPAGPRAAARSTPGSSRAASACRSPSRCGSPRRTTCGSRRRTVARRRTSRCTSTCGCRTRGTSRPSSGSSPRWAAGRTGARCTGSRPSSWARCTPASPTPSACAPRPTPTGVFSNPYLDRLLGSGHRLAA